MNDGCFIRLSFFFKYRKDLFIWLMLQASINTTPYLLVHDVECINQCSAPYISSYDISHTWYDMNHVFYNMHSSLAILLHNIFSNTPIFNINTKELYHLIWVALIFTFSYINFFCIHWYIELVVLYFERIWRNFIMTIYHNWRM